jgi:hypothetical protein
VTGKGLIAALATVVAGAAAPAVGAAIAPGMLAADGAWSWFADPRAVYHAGAHHRTYAGWVTSGGDIVVASYDLDTHTATGRVLAPRFQADDHANPALYVRRDGRIAAFWSAHNGPLMYDRVTMRPEDVTAWGPVMTVSTDTSVTYPNPLRVEGRLWLFWRGGDGQPAFSTSPDDGGAWTPARTLLAVPGERPYVKYAAGGGDTIHIAFTDGNPDHTATSLYYAAYRSGRLYRADGSEIAELADAPIAPAQADRVHDAAPRAWVHDVAADAAGRAVIVYATFPSDLDHRYRYARWTGSAWADTEITAAGPAFPELEGNNKYSGGIVLDHEDPSVVWLSREADGRHVVERWHTPDGGATWSSERMSAATAVDDVRPATPRGLPAGRATEALWMHGTYAGYTDYRTALMGLLDDAASPATIEPLPAPAAPGAAGALPAAAPPAVAPRQATLLRLAVRRLGARVRITGHLLDRATRAGLAGRQLTLLARRAGTRRFKRVATLRTGPRGRAQRKRRLRTTTVFRLRFAGEGTATPSRSRPVRALDLRGRRR